MSQPQAYVPPPRGGRRTPPRVPEQPPRRRHRRSAAAIGAVPLFAGLPTRWLERVAREADELTFSPGERIVEEGMLGETLFVVLEGQGRVLRGGRRVGEVVPGDFFGELSVIDGGPRSATVVAETPMRVLRLYRRALLALWRSEPRAALRVLDGIVRRLREVERSHAG
ncbi:MAG: cyclic nucleotide-binding protein [Actinomycetota bacterium]|jgi:CRP/FNR family cyclic AMP-dependent transcriptional regulator|nr:MAG: cyclic nucleotide-binding protein [Actinomycetota bacterium]